MLLDLLLNPSARTAKAVGALALAMAVLPMASCIDDNYDLSDIDTNVRLSVNDLTIPVNLDEITLDNLIDIKPDGILQTINGEYAILRTGSFSSSDLKIDPITITAPKSEPSVTIFLPELPATPAGMRAPAEDVTFAFSASEGSPISYTYEGVSDDIMSIKKLAAAWTINYDVTLSTGATAPAHFTLDHIKFQLPKGLTGTPSIGTYDPSTGHLTINTLVVTGSRLKFTMDVTAIDATKANVVFDPATHHLEISESSGLIDGRITIALAELVSGGIPQQIKVTTALTLSRIDITAFSGSIKYDIDDLDIAPVKLNDLPDVLSQAGTDVKIANPQIYLSVTNPFTKYNLHATTGFTLISNRPDQSPVRSSIDDGSFTIGSAAKSYYCLSPSVPSKYYEGYASATHVPFTSLSDAFAGRGLPHDIVIDLDPTLVPVQEVEDFTLGSYPAVDGEYVFYAPLQLAAGSVIEYTSTEDGWSDETLEKLTVTKLAVTASLTTNVPFDLEITGYPIDKNGKQITGVEIKGATVKANTPNQALSIHVTGTITNLDGIRFSAHAVSPADAKPLTPSQNISLKDIRATVSGYYDDEL